MVTHASVPVPQPSRPSPRTPLRILRTETVLSRFPIHNLTTHGRVSIHLRRTNAQGDLDLPLGGLHQHALWPARAPRLQTGYPGDQPAPRCPAAPGPRGAHSRELAPGGPPTGPQYQWPPTGASQERLPPKCQRLYRHQAALPRPRRAPAAPRSGLYALQCASFRGSGCPMAPRPTPSTWSSASPIGRSSTMPRCGRSTMPTCRPSRPWPNGSTNS